MKCPWIFADVHEIDIEQENTKSTKYIMSWVVYCVRTRTKNVSSVVSRKLCTVVTHKQFCELIRRLTHGWRKYFRVIAWTWSRTSNERNAIVYIVNSLVMKSFIVWRVSLINLFDSTE